MLTSKEAVAVTRYVTPIDVSPLFEPLTIKDRLLRNRIVMPPMVVNRGLATSEGAEWYGRRAQGGVGLVIVEATSVGDFGSTLTADNLRPLVDAVHAGGALIAIQLFPVNRFEPTAPGDLSLAQIDQMIADYRTATQVCAEAGFDGVEPHGAHGYALNQFFSPEKNSRTDEYGGALQNRMRLALRIVEAVRPICDAGGLLLLYRHTPVGYGYGIEDSLALAEELVGAGVDVLDMSPSSVNAPGDRAAPFMALDVPVIAVNELDQVNRALEVLREGRASLIAVGRGLIADADWAAKVHALRFGDICECVYCDECFTDLDAGIPVGCTQWD
jgi:2,4-dienoyl-CoA reductase-like NADH-dependent reductase (Old Yellow Enzyme family)